MARDISFSILDLSQIGEGGTATEALANSARIAQRAEALGYHRYWLAEHHGMPGTARAAKGREMWWWGLFSSLLSGEVARASIRRLL